MCILFIYTDPSPPENGYRLIVATNRDEYYERPTATAYHCIEENIIGGRDLQPGKEGGMWLGVSLTKTENYKLRLGTLLNVTGENRKGKGRGFIIYNYLKGNLTADAYIQSLPDEHSAYNFVTAELSENGTTIYHASNSPSGCTKFAGRQVLGFGNSTLSRPLQKVVNGRQRFEEIVTSEEIDKDELIVKLLELLNCVQRHLPDDELQRRSPVYELLSSIFVKVDSAGYGTRAQTLIFVNYNWELEFIEVAMEDGMNVKPTWQSRNFKIQL
ncbi:hypothetical protein RI129_012672 [Pyrocoelia pectoralis]|uniref:Uncharacterized protein n=1 Tax=Pyrocoelia pectoralis TaxID=417401 RepID=A0AAN7ZCA9_9COLE